MEYQVQITDFISGKMNSADRKLLEEIYKSEYQNLINYAGYILYNSECVEDAVQETFTIAVYKITDLRSSNNQVGWLYRTLQNVVRNKNREIQKPNKLTNKIIQSIPDQVPETTVEFESNILFYESYKQHLSETDWTLLCERYCEGYQYEELSKRHNLSISACKMRILRAKSVLRKEIEKDNKKL